MLEKSACYSIRGLSMNILGSTPSRSVKEVYVCSRKVSTIVATLDNTVGYSTSAAGILEASKDYFGDNYPDSPAREPVDGISQRALAPARSGEGYRAGSTPAPSIPRPKLFGVHPSPNETTEGRGIFIKTKPQGSKNPMNDETPSNTPTKDGPTRGIGPVKSSGFLPARKAEDLNAEEWSYITAAVGRYRHDHERECEGCGDFLEGSLEEPCDEQRFLAHLEEVTGHIAKEMSP